MAGKIFTALTKIEADTYWSRGRLKEAMDIYVKLLSSPNITLNTRAAIESRVQVLKDELDDVSPSKSDDDLESAVMKLQAAIAQDESVNDLQQDVTDYIRQGSYADALESLKQLIRLNAGDEFCVNSIAECLAKLYCPQEIAVAVDLLLVEAFKNPEKASLFKVILAEKMANKGYSQYADILHRHKDRFSVSTL